MAVMINFTKALTGDTATMVFYAKRLLDGGETPFSKADFVDAIQARADATLPDKLTPQQRFSRAISGGDEVAMTLYRACKMAPGSEVRPPIEKEDDGPRHIGEAHARMYSLGVDRQRERSIPFAAAYSEVYTAPANAALRAAVQREHLQHQMEMMGDAGGIHGHAMSIDEAQTLAEANPSGGGKVKPFPASAYGASQAKKSDEAELAKLATKYREANPGLGLSFERAFTKVLTAPENRALAKRALAVA